MVFVGYVVLVLKIPIKYLFIQIGIYMNIVLTEKISILVGNK
jgi:hypothetical protein